jgi:sortase A
VYETPFAVQPDDLTVLKNNPLRPAILTLTTCTPKFSAAQRLVVHAALKGKPLPAPVIKHKLKLTTEGLSGQTSSKTPAVIAGLIAAVVGLLWWLLFHRHPRWTTWLIGVLPFAVALFFFYSYLERVLPANY